MSKQVAISKNVTITKKEIDAYVGKRLRQRRTMLGLSQEALAEAVGITFQQVQKYEKGVNAMSASRLYEFACFMRIPVAYFFEGMDADEASKEQGGGFSEGKAETFSHPSSASVSDREALELMKAFQRIEEQPMRKRLADLVRAIADEKSFVNVGQ